MVKIIHNKKECIGCGACIGLCPKYFEIEDGGKAYLKGSKLNSKTGQYEIKAKSTRCVQEAADMCPSQCIYIKKKV